jgi:formate dehydrogenase maturation protein FdhE
VVDLRTRIAALAAAEPALADELALRGALIEIVDHAEVGPIEIRLPGDLARARLAAGTPLLDGLNIPIPPGIVALFERLTVAMLADPAARLPAEAILAAVRAHRLHAEQVVAEAIVGHADHLAALAEGVDVPIPLLASLADLAARPLLAEVAQRLGPALALGSWARGSCPICGGRPVFAEQVSLSGGDARLRCGRCGTAWAWNLHQCGDCSTGRLAMIDTATALETPHWRLFGCDACNGYLKVTDLVRSERLADLMLTDLESWRIDQQALGQGLNRLAEVAYRLEHGEPPGSALDDD